MTKEKLLNLLEELPQYHKINFMISNGDVLEINRLWTVDVDESYITLKRVDKKQGSDCID